MLGDRANVARIIDRKWSIFVADLPEIAFTLLIVWDSSPPRSRQRRRINALSTRILRQHVYTVTQFNTSGIRDMESVSLSKGLGLTKITFVPLQD